MNRKLGDWILRNKYPIAVIVIVTSPLWIIPMLLGCITMVAVGFIEEIVSIIEEIFKD